jgi:hypothetical protein
LRKLATSVYAGRVNAFSIVALMRDVYGPIGRDPKGGTSWWKVMKKNDTTDRARCDRTVKSALEAGRIAPLIPSAGFPTSPMA